MNFLGNLLKLTDYPFAYSITSLFVLTSGQSIDWNHPTNLVPLIALVSILGTTLTIIDPFGNILRFFIRIFGSNFSFFGKHDILIRFTPKKPQKQREGWFMRFAGKFSRRKTPGHLKIPARELTSALEIPTLLGLLRTSSARFGFGIRTESFEYFYHLNAKAVITNWATFEIDKTVSTLYFLSILCYLSFLLIYNPNAYLNNISHIFSTANQTSDTANQPSKNPRCKDNNCSPINLNTLREAILIATIATGIIAAASIRRLSRRVQIIIIYFTSYDHIIPKLKLDRPESKKILDDHKELNKNMENKDWGMAEYFCTTMLDSLEEILDKQNLGDYLEIPKEQEKKK